MRYLITGIAGFIGSHLALRLSKEPAAEILGIDNINSYYDPRIKAERLRMLGFDLSAMSEEKALPVAGTVREEVTYKAPRYNCEIVSQTFPNLKFRRVDITDADSVENLFNEFLPEVVINLAAQAGVRYSIENPRAYVETNIGGFLNMLECARKYPVSQFLYASSSSVYGGNSKVPFAEEDRVDNPVSIYAATKKSNELFASVYNHLYNIPLIGLRFFTVYGPWGRPDMAPMLFAEAISSGKPIKVFNNGIMKRDFTFIDDIIEGIISILDGPVGKGSKVYNIGCGHPEDLGEFISLIERNLGLKAQCEYLPMQPGDVPSTFADTTSLQKDFGYLPSISLSDGIERFIRWFKDNKAQNNI